MWLNEGFTVFEERKVSAFVHGDDFSKVNAYLGNLSMVNAMKDFGFDKNYSSLYPLVGKNLPDESFSTVPYEKGFQLLYYIETLIGKDHIQKLIQTHINKYAGKSINYTAFVNVFNDYTDTNLPDNATFIKSKMDWDTWVHSPGTPYSHGIMLDFTTPDLNRS